MKFLTILCAATLGLTAPTSPSLAHGGGCLEVYMPQQCCHMDNKKGYQHCH